MDFLAGAVAAGRVDVVDMPEIPISSTEVRARIARGEDVLGARAAGRGGHAPGRHGV
jgi:hypothetical protein